jgi:hypothetical protein
VHLWHNFIRIEAAPAKQRIPPRYSGPWSSCRCLTLDHRTKIDAHSAIAGQSASGRGIRPSTASRSAKAGSGHASTRSIRDLTRSTTPNNTPPVSAGSLAVLICKMRSSRTRGSVTVQPRTDTRALARRHPGDMAARDLAGAPGGGETAGRRTQPSVGRSQVPARMLHQWILIKRCNDRIKFMGISRRTEQRGNQLDRTVVPFDDSNVANGVVRRFQLRL